MGVVFVGRHETLGREAAIKVVLGVSHRALGRFRIEAETTARLQHPNIVAVHEVGVHEGRPYLSDTWERTGARWEERSTQGPAPIGRAWHTLVYDSKRGRTLLFGGMVKGASPSDDLWSWNGTTWERIPAPFGPQGRVSLGGVFDTARGLLLIHAGRSGRSFIEDLWSCAAGASAAED